MRADEVVDRLTRAFPRSATWERLAGEPYGPANVNPAADLERILYCVTATPEVEEFYERRGYGLLVAHHPFRPAAAIPNVLLHTALDCAPGGLNDIWRDALGLREAQPITGNLGWVGRVDPVGFEELLEQALAVAGGIEGQVSTTATRVESVAVCTGLGGMVAAEAAATGADVYVTGELVQPASAMDVPAVIEVGHTRSEWVGVNSIRNVLGPDVRVDVAPLGIDWFSGEVFRGEAAA